MMPKAPNELYKKLLKQRQGYISIAFVGLDFSPTLVSINIYVVFFGTIVDKCINFHTKIKHISKGK